MATNSSQLLRGLTIGDIDVRELTFQNVVNNVLVPAGVKMGGFPDELFTNISKEEHDDMMCNICYLIANDCRQCDNRHVFCHACIVAWMMTFGDNAQKCPMCRCTQMEYNVNEQLHRRINSKYVRCLTDGCNFSSTLADYVQHCHGNALYSNLHVDLDSLRPRFVNPSQFNYESQSPAVPTNLRTQLLQSRTIIRQMMSLMRIEMQLRQQALLGLQRAQDAQNARLQQQQQHLQQQQIMNRPMALSEQLAEMSNLLSSLSVNNTSSLLIGGHGRRRILHRDITARTRRRRLDTSSPAIGPFRPGSSSAGHRSMMIGSYPRPIPNDSEASDNDDYMPTDLNIDSLFGTESDITGGDNEDDEDSDEDISEDDDDEEADISSSFRENAAMSAALCTTDEDDEQLWQELTRDDSSTNDLNIAAAAYSCHISEEDLADSPDIPSPSPDSLYPLLMGASSMFPMRAAAAREISSFSCLAAGQPSATRRPGIVSSENYLISASRMAETASGGSAMSSNHSSNLLMPRSNMHSRSSVSFAHDTDEFCSLCTETSGSHPADAANKLTGRNDSQRSEPLTHAPLQLVVRRPTIIPPVGRGSVSLANASTVTSPARVSISESLASTSTVSFQSESRLWRPTSYISDASRPVIPIGGLGPSSSLLNPRSLPLPPRCLRPPPESFTGSFSPPFRTQWPLTSSSNLIPSRDPSATGSGSRTGNGNSSNTWPLSGQRRLARPQRQNKLSDE